MHASRRRQSGALRPGARRALLAVAALTVLALLASLRPQAFAPLLPALRDQVDPPVESQRLPALDWQARIALLAGDGHRGLVDGPARVARFDEPWGVVRGSDGRVYVADGGQANRIRVIAPDSTVSTLAGGVEGFADGVGAAARLHTPSALAIDAQGNLYVADTGNHAIRRISPRGEVTTVAGNGEPGFVDGGPGQSRLHAPMGVAVDAGGRVFVADTWNDAIRVIDTDGQLRTLAGGGGPGYRNGSGAQVRFDTPTALALDGDGVLWVADTGNAALRRIDADGTVQEWRGWPWQVEAVGMGRPLSVAVGEGGRLYVGELAPGRVLELTRDGRARVLTGADSSRWFARPSALWRDGDGSLLLADAAGHRLHRLEAQAVDAASGAPVPVADDPLGPHPARALPDTAGRWPLAPQDGWHEVVGTLGEVRGDFRGQARHHLHNGLDIRGDIGTAVLAIADAKVSSPLAAYSFGGQAEGISLDEIGYVHMRVGRTAQGRPLDPRFLFVAGDDGRPGRVRIPRGTRFAAGDALGTINAQAHVHLIVGPPGYQHNAVRLGFANYRDTVPPRIESVSLLDADDRPLRTRVDGRVLVPADARLQVVVDAWDQVDGNLPRRRLGLHRVGFEVRDAQARPLPGHAPAQANIDFSTMPAQPDAVLVAYAADSGITVHGAARTRFLYVASNLVRREATRVQSWQPSALPPGDYLLRAFAEDASGNAAIGARDLPIRVVAGGAAAAQPTDDVAAIMPLAEPADE